MIIAFTDLIYIGLNLVPMIYVAAEVIAKPTLRAQPNSVITKGMQVTILCVGSSSAQEYYLYKEGSPDPWQRQNPTGSENRAEFFFSSIQQNHAGRYCCYFKTPVGWSERSDFLVLMVTGFYKKPSLSALPSPVVPLGRNVTLQCASQLGYDGFSLTKEEPQKFSWTLDSQYIYSNNNFRALFSEGSVTSGERRTFRCYGYYLSKPQVWSEPSEPLELLVSVPPRPPSASPHLIPHPFPKKGKESQRRSVQSGVSIGGSPVTTNQPKNISEATEGPETQDYTVENLIRLGMSGLIIIVLGIFLIEACRSQRRTLTAS